jgi:uncharacterized protein
VFGAAKLPHLRYEIFKLILYNTHMTFIRRAIQSTVIKAARNFPAVVLTGPRRAGKTTLLRRLFPLADYVLLEDPDVQDRARSDPRALLEELHPPVLFDEIQHVPELLGYIRSRIDKHPRQMGQWLFTGSQEAPLMQGVSESMAGRAAILQLLPFSLAETDRVSLLLGGYPEVLAHPQLASRARKRRNVTRSRTFVTARTSRSR